ncbi:MAG: MFS transporter [Streptosporangiaceae bacterium]|jgi:EmrB/QacA subfamily drug resistance transporter
MVESSSAPAGRPASAGLDPRRWWALALLCGAFFMVLLDGTITIVALPSIGAGQRFSEQGLQWVLSAYALTFGGLLLLGGRAADLLGRRRVFMAGVLLFTAASRLCGLAWSLAARVVQGSGSAIMTPNALSIISTTFTEGSERNKALGIWGALGGIGATTAWLIGGPLVDGPGWRWIFFINVPIGLAALALPPVLLRESRAALTRRSYDPAGALTITGALVLLVYAVVEAPGAGWGNVRTILPLARSAVLIAAFALIESRHPAPLVPLRIFRSRALAGADALTILIGTVAAGMPFVLTLYAQQVLGYSALKFGISSVVLALGATAGAIAGQAAVGKAGFRPAAATGLALMAAGSLVLTQVSIPGSYFPDIFIGLLLCGLGTGLAFVTATVAALAGVARARGRARLGPEQHRLADRHSARRRHRHDRCRLPLPALPGSAQKARTRSPRWPRATSPPSWPAPCWPGSAWRWRSCSPADRGSQRTSCQSRTRRPMPLPLPQETW